MNRIQLPVAELESLEGVLLSTDDTNPRQRVQIVLMAHRGTSLPRFRRRHRPQPARPVQRWLNAYLDGGLDRLRPRKARGAAPRFADDLDLSCASG